MKPRDILAIEERGAKELLKEINFNRDAYFKCDYDFCKEFNKKYYYILFEKNKLEFNDSFVKCFEVLMDAIDVCKGFCKNVNAFYHIRLLIEKRLTYNVEQHENVIRGLDKKRFSIYLVAYAYYYDLSLNKLDSMLNYFNTNFDEILDWCIVNGGSYCTRVTEEISWYNIKEDFYQYVTNYLLSKTNNKKII